ncbi:MAG TPA: NAD(P)-dependent oxidoreductase [Verrucomicrobiae bacterium]|nr:NAD(P)-dependent oxidoreductase [Verrucomicrobiae bacterium]
MADRIGFVGIGRMGANMARRLKDEGENIAAVYDVRRDAAIALANELGCAAPEKLAGVTAASDVIFTVVTDDAAMRRIFAAPSKGDGLLLGARGRLFINCATITPSVHREVERVARRSGATTLAACMASSITQARDGTLYLMCGGESAAFNRARPLLEKLAGSIRHVGSAEQAAILKALVNMVMNINTAALAEGLALADAEKLDLALVRDVFSQTGAASRVLQTDGEDMQNREHSCFFSAEHAAKDSGIALRLATEKGLDLALAAATKRQFARMVKEGLGQLDKSGIAELTFKGRHGRRRRR